MLCWLKLFKKKVALLLATPLLIKLAYRLCQSCQSRTKAAAIHINVSMKPCISFMLRYSLLLLPGAGASSEIHLYQTQYYYSLTCHMPLTTPVGSAFFCSA